MGDSSGDYDQQEPTLIESIIIAAIVLQYVAICILSTAICLRCYIRNRKKRKRLFTVPHHVPVSNDCAIELDKPTEKETALALTKVYRKNPIIEESDIPGAYSVVKLQSRYEDVTQESPGLANPNYISNTENRISQQYSKLREDIEHPQSNIGVSTPPYCHLHDHSHPTDRCPMQKKHPPPLPSCPPPKTKPKGYNQQDELERVDEVEDGLVQPDVVKFPKKDPPKRMSITEEIQNPLEESNSDLYSLANSDIEAHYSTIESENDSLVYSLVGDVKNDNESDFSPAEYEEFYSEVPKGDEVPEASDSEEEPSGEIRYKTAIYSNVTHYKKPNKKSDPHSHMPVSKCSRQRSISNIEACQTQVTDSVKKRSAVKYTKSNSVSYETKEIPSYVRK